MALDGFVQRKCKGIVVRDEDGISVCNGRGRCHSSSITCGWPSSNRKLFSATVKARAVVTPAHTNIKFEDEEDFIKAGGSEISYVQMQATKTTDQPNIADKDMPKMAYAIEEIDSIKCHKEKRNSTYKASSTQELPILMSIEEVYEGSCPRTDETYCLENPY